MWLGLYVDALISCVLYHHPQLFLQQSHCHPPHPHSSLQEQERMLVFILNIKTFDTMFRAPLLLYIDICSYTLCLMFFYFTYYDKLLNNHYEDNTKMHEVPHMDPCGLMVGKKKCLRRNETKDTKLIKIGISNYFAC